MTKRLKNVLLIVLASLLVACGVFLLIPRRTVSAAQQGDNPKQNEHFKFVDGAEIDYEGFADGNYKMAFELEQISTKFSALSTNLFKIKEHFWLGPGGGERYVNFSIQVFRCNADGKSATPLSNIMIGTTPETTEKGNKDYITGDLDRVIAEEYLSYYDEGINLDDSFLDSTTHGYFEQKTIESLNMASVYVGTQYIRYGDLKSGAGLFKAGDNDGRIIINVNSPYSSYFVRFNASWRVMTESKFAGTKWEEGSFSIDSDTRSIASILNNMYNDNALESVFPEEADYNRAMSIVSETNTKTVRVKYLKEIEGTPFATHDYVELEVPILDDTLHIDDVYGALGVSTLNVFNSSCNEFKKISDTEYEAVYLKSIKFRAITEDGKNVDYYLDINNSFHDFYKPFVDAGVFPSEMKEYIFNNLLQKNPKLVGYSYDEVYGYFGMAVTPNTHTLNTLWVEMFDIEKSVVGAMDHMEYDGKISYDNYMKLLNDFNYSWLTKAWESVVGFVQGSEWSAHYYVFYSNPEKSAEFFIGEGGQESPEDTDSVTGGAIKDVTSEVGETVGDLLNTTDKLMDAATTILGNAADTVQTAANNSGKIMTIGGGIILIAGVALLVVTLAKKKKS